MQKIKSAKLFLPSILAVLAILISISYLIGNATSKKSLNPEEQKKEVLGSKYQAPQIYFYDYGDKTSAAGGLISLSSTADPIIRIGSYKASGKAEIEVYESNDDAALDYLAHDKDGNQIKRSPDKDKIKFITKIDKEIKTGENETTEILLPISGKGVWYLKAKVGGIVAESFVIRSENGTIVKEADNEFVFWGQNFKSKRSVSEGAVILYDLENGRKELERASFSSDGIARARINGAADIALVAVGDDRAIIPLNLQYLNSGYTYQTFGEKIKKTKYFVFTDRPLYKPGDTIHFKAILRDDDDARYSIPSGNVAVKIFDGYEYSDSEKTPVYQQSSSVSSDGTVAGSYKLPNDAKVGSYTLSVNTGNQTETSYYDNYYSSNNVYFSVEHFKKPEFFLDIVSENTEAIATDELSFKILGSYFSGQPLSKEKVKYTVTAYDYYEYAYLSDQEAYASFLSDDYRYGSYWSGGEDSQIKSQTISLDEKGEAEVSIKSKNTTSGSKTKVYTIEATLADGSRAPSFSRKNILVYSGEYGIYKKDYSYGGKVNSNYSLPIKLLAHKGNADISGINLAAKVQRIDWEEIQEKNKKYPTYREVKETLPDLKAKTDDNGDTSFNFTPSKTGQYTITVEGKDRKGNAISKVFYLYFSSEERPYYSEGGNSEITVSLDKQKYQPTDTAKISVNSYVPDRDVFLSLERGRMDRFKVVHLNGKSGSVEIPLVSSDVPNMFAQVSSFDDNQLNENQISIPVSSEGRKVVIKINPNSKKFGPGETVDLDIETQDTSGNPLSAEVAVWSVDKAIFELTDNNLGDIFKVFWQERYNTTQKAHSLEGILVNQAEGGGCFVSGTQVLMEGGLTKNIEDIKPGEYVLTRGNESDSRLVKGKVTGTHVANETGYLIINRDLKVTANHIMYVNGFWKEAGSIQVGDNLTKNDGTMQKVSSVEFYREKVKVYNLEIEKYHTYFANGIWVHNQKGDGARNEFKDTAYWNPSVRTDASGKAQVSFKLPDNLTTWTLAAVAATPDTRVGQTTEEIVVTKDIVIRPILPNIMREGDEIVLSALIQNFTDSPQKMDIKLEFDSGKIDKPSFPNTLIASGDSKQVYWKIKVGKEKSKAKLVFSAKVVGNNKLADILTQEIPVLAFGFEEKRAEAGEGNKNYEIKLSKNSLNEKSKAILYLSSTLVGSLPTAMNYLIGYPYGCVEQTTSRFVPAVIAKANSALFAEALKGKKIDDIIQKGVDKLSTQQRPDGGWTWWYSGDSDSFVTAYVIEYVIAAQKYGAKVDKQMIDSAKRYAQDDTYYDKDLKNQVLSNEYNFIIPKNYILTLMGDGKKVRHISDYTDISPDLLSLAVMTNYLNGDKNPDTNGLKKLISLGKTQGDSLFWEAGEDENFGSKDASTALAIRAILLSEGDREAASKGVRYLTRTRKSDYWSNTFATAQVVAAITDYSKSEESTTNYSYAVTLDGKKMSGGSVSNSRQIIPELNIPFDKLKKNGSRLGLTKSGDGQIYSTLIINEFNTDRKAKAIGHGMSIKREYVNEKGNYSLGVGDVAIVKLTLDGLSAEESYGVIRDELPSGMVPVNESFKNEQYGEEPDYYSYDYADKEYTQNGVIFSLNRVGPGKHTYTYRARVVNEGKFIAPPAVASLMYAPEIYARSNVQTISIAKESQALPGDSDSSSTTMLKQILFILGLVIAGVFFYLFRNDKREFIKLKEKLNKHKT